MTAVGERAGGSLLGEGFPSQASQPARRRRSVQLSRGVTSAAVTLAILHLLNFLNYTVLLAYVQPSITRSALLISFALFSVTRYTANLQFHARRAWDMYAICVLAMASATYSSNPSKTLTYATWLLLAVYAGTELSARIRKPTDVVAALGIVILPTSIFVALVNLTMGPIVLSTGRHFGALGSAHVDTACAMVFISFFLAMRAFPGQKVRFPRWLRLTMWGVLAWAAYQAVFGLTRSVWLGVVLATGLYFLRRSLTLKSLAVTIVLAFMTIVVVDVVGLDRIIPDAVEGRIAVTEQRYESGTIDPRIQGIRMAVATAFDKPMGTGYAVASSHNSYTNILLNLGWLGFFVGLFAIGRSALLVLRTNFGWTMFFAIGCGPLLLHAFFEVQTWPGQANFVPLLAWYAIARARLEQVGKPAATRSYTRPPELLS